MSQFSFMSPGQVLFGEGTAAKVPDLAHDLGGPVFLVTGSSIDRVAPVRTQLEERGLLLTCYALAGEPTTALAREAAEAAREAQCRTVIAIGGGSVLDLGKAVSALLTNTGDLFDYLEVIGRALPLEHPAAPMIAVPTTAGTGSEVTKNAVLDSPEHRVKVSMRHPWMIPAAAVIDPELTFSMPPEVTAATGMDALAQVLEPFVSCKANPFTDALCREGIVYAGRSLLRAYQDGTDPKARREMCLVSLFGGLALANAGLGAVHGFAGPIGGMYEAPHGGICARLLPLVFRENAALVSGTSREKFSEAAKLFTGNPEAEIDDAAAFLDQLARDLQIPGLSAYGIKPQDIPAVTAKAAMASSMKGNPVELSDDRLQAILAAAL